MPFGMEVLTSKRRGSGERPHALDVLLERYDPDVIDLLDRRARLRIGVGEGEWDVVLEGDEAWVEEPRGEPDAELSADAATWKRVARDVRGGMDAFRARRLRIRRNLHLGVGFLAATSANQEPGRLRFDSYRTPVGRISVMEAGQGKPVLCLPGLGGTKASFMTTVAALAPNRRVIAIDLPGFGDSHKPLTGRYDAAWFAQSVADLLDELGLERADMIGNSMGGRVAIELGLSHPERVRKLVLLSPAMAWLRRDRNIALLLQLPLPRLGMFKPTPRAIVEPIVRRLVPGGSNGWVAAGFDEFLRGYCTTGGRFAFYEAARRIYLDEPDGDDGFWTRLQEMGAQAMFVWGRHDTLVPIAFMKHVERVLPSARHLELECGHVPQLEAPAATHAAIESFLRRR
jgi:pimeloyl-ACP methyl ester carboxylesterase